MSQFAFSVRMDSQLKNGFSQICEDFGMPVSVAIILFAKAVVRERRIPFEIKSDLPNSLTRETIELAAREEEIHRPFSTVEDLRASLDA